MTTETTEPTNLKLEDFEGKRVVLVRLLKEPDASGSNVAELKGTVEKARTGMGVILKMKGRASLELIEPEEIDNIFIEQPGTRALKSKRLDVVEDAKLKQHLAQWHGTQLSWLNKASVEQAKEYHDGIDHSDFGHYHGEKPTKEPQTDREKAIAAASAQ